jgi:hypothetical protein
MGGKKKLKKYESQKHEHPSNQYNHHNHVTKTVDGEIN